MSQRDYERNFFTAATVVVVAICAVAIVMARLTTVRDGVIYVGTPPSVRAVEATKEAGQETQMAIPTQPPQQYITNGDTYYGKAIQRFYDPQAQVVCWGYFDAHAGGTLSCLPISQTNLRPEDFGGGQ